MVMMMMKSILTSFFPNLQDMTSAVITYCGHFFHGNCLRKWLYVQETCPMCHASIKPSSNPTAHPNPPPSEQHPRPESHEEEEEEEQGSQGDDDVCPPESDRKCSQSPQRLGANGDSQSVDNPAPSCSSEGDSQELREAD